MFHIKKTKKLKKMTEVADKDYKVVEDTTIV